jgi:hypothetical protein
VDDLPGRKVDLKESLEKVSIGCCPWISQCTLLVCTMQIRSVDILCIRLLARSCVSDSSSPDCEIAMQIGDHLTLQNSDECSNQNSDAGFRISLIVAHALSIAFKNCVEKCLCYGGV